MSTPKKPFSEMTLAEVNALPVTTIEHPEQPTTKRAREAREHSARARREREHQTRVAPLAELKAKTPVVNAKLAKATAFPNFSSVDAILRHRQQVQAKRQALEATRAEREAAYETRRQALTAANSETLMKGKDPDTTAVATLARAHHVDLATIDSELDALQQADQDLWHRFLAVFAGQVTAFQTTNGTVYRDLRRTELDLLEQLLEVQQQRVAQHHAAHGELGRIITALGDNAALGPATRTTPGARVMGVRGDTRAEVVIGRAPDTVEYLDSADAAVVRRFLQDHRVGLPLPALARDIPEVLLAELIKVLRAEVEAAK